MKHRPWCSCPQCYVGKPTEACYPDPHCSEGRNPIGIVQKCRSDRDCPQSLACNRAIGTCENPCVSTAQGYRISKSCSPNHRCEVQNHKPRCVCKHNLVINDRMELTCPGNVREEGCRADYECADNLACISNKCQSPCNSQFCEANKSCRVIQHKPICYCDNHECQATASICLKNSGCPPHLACVKYQCTDPCASIQCPGNLPCVVQDHVGTCKFCPPGYVADGRNGCKGNGSCHPT